MAGSREVGHQKRVVQAMATLLHGNGRQGVISPRAWDRLDAVSKNPQDEDDVAA